MTVWAANCFCHFSHYLEVTCLKFLLTQVILFPSQVSDGVENFIVIVFLVTRLRKEIHQRNITCINKVERHKKKVLLMQVRIESELWTHQDRIDMEYFL